MEDLTLTEVGLILRQNANWLYQQGVIDSGGEIKSNFVDGMNDRKVQLYSYFRWIVDDIKNEYSCKLLS